MINFSCNGHMMSNNSSVDMVHDAVDHFHASKKFIGFGDSDPHGNIYDPHASL